MTTIKIIWADNSPTTELNYTFEFEGESDETIIQMIYFTSNAQHILSPNNSDFSKGLDKNDQISIDDRRYIIKLEKGILFEPLL